LSSGEEITRFRINAMLSRIDHVGIAVRDLDEAIRIYEGRLGLRATGRERLEREGIEIAMIPIGESRLELIMPLNRESKVDKFLQDRGEAVHHVAYATDDVRASLEQAGAAGAQLLDQVARPGSHGTRIGFVHPKSVCGVLTEFVEADGKPGS
jgi:methylmalonyl-CoA/ethylmalonyl-CoA epimerase